MKAWISLFICFILTVYFGITFVYNLPDNFVKLKHKNDIAYAEDFFHQEWNFFAPPPKSNLKVIFSYKYKNEEHPFLELDPLTDIVKKKQKYAPFNTRYEILDYQISSCVNSITKNTTIIYNFNKFKSPTQRDSILIQKTYEQVDKELSSSPMYKTLINYSKVCFDKANVRNHKNKDSIQVRIYVLESPIMPFSSFFSLSKVNKLDTMKRCNFQSKYNDLKL